MTEAKLPAPKVPATPATPATTTPEIVTEFVPSISYGMAIATLVIGLAIGVGVYYVLTHVMIEDADDGR